MAYFFSNVMFMFVDADSLLRQNLNRLFGEQSTLNVSELTATVMTAPIENPVYKIFTIVLMLVYIYFIFIFIDEIKILFKTVFVSDVGSGENTGNTLSSFLTVMSVLGGTALSLLCTDYFWMKEAVHDRISLTWLFTIIFLFFMLWMFLRWCIIKISGILTQRRSFAEEFLFCQNSFFVIFSVFMIPVVLIAAFNKAETRGIIYFIFVVMTVIYYISYFFRTLCLFVKEKISILFCFLYLCIVDIMPIVTLVVLMLNIR